MSFIDNVKKIKHESGMTAAELCSVSGVPLGTLNKLLSGAIEEPRLSVAVALAQALGCSLDELCDNRRAVDCLSRDEEKLLDDFRNADSCGRDILLTIAGKEAARYRPSATILPSVLPVSASDCPASQKNGASDKKILLPLFFLPVSAGRGVFLDGDESETIQVDDTKITAQADFALRVSGNSMEPLFHNNDILLIRKQETVEKGEYGIFIGDGEGYFKCFLGDRLHSLNPEYADIPLCNFTAFSCCGKVIGRVPRRLRG